MKTQLRNVISTSFVAALLCLYAVSCKKDDPKPALLATVATTAPSAITESSATTGGTIGSDGGSTVTEAGIVYSTIKPAPTTSDEKKTSTTLTGAFTVNLTGLNSGTNYFVRAYAINSVGTSYGEPVILTTGNLAPVAKNVTVTGVKVVDQKLTATYTYSDAENNAEAGTTFKWYRASDAAGAGEVAIDGATKIDYTLVAADVGKFVRIGVTPKAAAGTSTGAEVKSTFTGPVDAVPNNAPTATINAVTGTLAVFETLTVAYTYADTESDAESGTTFKWYRANDASGAGETAIAGALGNTYTLVDADGSKFIRIGVTPKSSAGTLTGAEVKSTFQGPVTPATVTFLYNGANVTYGLIKSSATGRIWMDRNLGAQQAATKLQDHLAYGDLFQWGRGTDGHQLINWTQDILVGSSAPVNGSTATLSTSDSPGNALFVTTSTNPFDWSSPQNGSRWTTPNYINNPCPSGWHIPTSAEWTAENIDPVASNQLKITAAGGRRPDNGALYNNSIGPGREGTYWASTGASSPSGEFGADAYDFAISSSGSINSPWQLFAGTYPAYGYSCRCIKNL